MKDGRKNTEFLESVKSVLLSMYSHEDANRYTVLLQEYILGSNNPNFQTLSICEEIVWSQYILCRHGNLGGSGYWLIVNIVGAISRTEIWYGFEIAATTILLHKRTTRHEFSSVLNQLATARKNYSISKLINVAAFLLDNPVPVDKLNEVCGEVLYMLENMKNDTSDMFHIKQIFPTDDFACALWLERINHVLITYSDKHDCRNIHGLMKVIGDS